MTPSLARDRGVRTFLLVWSGQTVSMVGDSLTLFAVGVWIYQETRAVAPLALMLLLTLLPGIVAGPVCGVLVDRWDRRRVLVACNLGAALLTALPVALLLAGRFGLWSIYAAIAGKSLLRALQGPAWEASVALLVPREQLGRAGGMTRFGLAVGEILAPGLGAVLMLTVKLAGVLLVDLATFVFATATLLAARFPPAPTGAPAAEVERGSVLRDAGYGLRWLAGRPGLRGVLAMSAAVAFGGGAYETMLTPALLQRFSVPVLGLVTSAGGVGFLVGGVLMTSWGGPARRIHGVVGGWALAGVFLALTALMPTPALAAAAFFAAALMHPVAQGSGQALWQSVTPPEVQGRVFSTRNAVQLSALPPAYLLAGAVADRLGAGGADTLAALLAGAAAIVVAASAAAALVPAVMRVDDLSTVPAPAGTGADAEPPAASPRLVEAG
jgi:DHA3 family macrolide efflux protein-like MFS transporter